MTREYIVSLNADVNYDEFWSQIENLSQDDGFVPDRRVDILNERPGSSRSCHYALTDQEADLLRNDPRVRSVEIPPEQRDDIQIGLKYNSQIGNFTKTTFSTGDNLNWGLRRCIDYTNPYGTGDVVIGDYHYVNDGTGVDIVIQDSGLQHEHPEFQDGENSRVQLIDWYSESGLPGSQSVNFYRDLDGHGTHVGGIAAGTTYGWAKKSRIYSLKIRGLEGVGDTDPVTGLGSGIVIADCFDVIKLWHMNKPIDPITGYKRPTIVNMSWGFFTTYQNITGGTYRGTPWIDTVRKPEFGMIGVPYTLGINAGNVRVGSVDSDVDELIAAGIIVCIAAGNSYDKIDNPGGLDYDNFYTKTSVGNVYYHRGSSPHSDDAIIVGSIDSVVPEDLEQKSDFSCTGPGVDIWAPGSNILSCTSNTNAFNGQSYYADGVYKQVNLSGTSMASPQVAGVAALYVQSYPETDPAGVKTFLQSQSDLSGSDRLIDSGLDDDYENDRSLLGSPQHFLYWPYSQGFPEGPASITARLTNVNLTGSVNIRFR
jgi:subtilisin family serine protease